MPVNYLDIQRQIPDFCNRTGLRQRNLGELRTIVRNNLDRWAVEGGTAREKILAESRKNNQLRCAVPTDEMLNGSFSAIATPFSGAILAADGSQVVPSRHHQVEFGALNIAAVTLLPGSGQAPSIERRSQLLDADELAEGDGPASEAYIALLRDLKEREISIDLVDGLPQPVITLTDGGLELFREPRASKSYDRVLDEYIHVLERLAQRGVIYTGYVDKPGSNLVVSMLAVLTGEEDALERYAGLIDRTIFADILHEPGARSAVFAIQSPQSSKFSGPLAVHFFYMNVSAGADPQIVRVEIPGFVAGSPETVSLLQSVLLEQCRASGGRPFPYLIHRAHEEAVIKYEESAQLENMILTALMERQIEFGEKSGKQTMKDLSGRTRMGK